MSLFEGIGFENFRVFQKQKYFDFAPITIITGTNNSGKSGLLNGIKLLQENFKDIKRTFKPRMELNLGDIMLTKIEPRSLLEKYGNLNQFITKGGKKSEFKFLYRRKMILIDDEVEITFTIEINNNPVKDAYIKELRMKSVSTGKPIFNITRVLNRDAQFSIYLDLPYFFDAVNQRITRSNDYYAELDNWHITLQKLNTNPETFQQCELSLKLFNKKYNTSYVLSNGIDGYSIDEPVYFPDEHYFDEPAFISKKVLKTIMAENELSEGLYDFSFLWEFDSEKQIIYDQILGSFYKKLDRNTQIKLGKDILRFLSDIEWPVVDEPILSGSGINYTINRTEHCLGIGLKKFTELFTNFSRQNNSTSILVSLNKQLEIYEDNMQGAIVKNTKFYEEVLKPLLQLVVESYFEQLQNTEPKPIKFARTRNLMAFDKLVPKESEILLNNLILDNLNIIQNCIAALINVNFLPTNKTLNKRIFALSDTDEFTQLIRKLEGKPLKQRTDAYEFINKWLKEFDIADSFSIQHDTDSGNFKPYLKVKGENILMADFGVGTSQILPILLKIIPEVNEEYEMYQGITPEYNSRVVVLEEPEANLHPALQSKLADLIVESYKRFNLQIIIETHSEYLIRKLQFLTGKGMIKTTSSQIYYFYHPDKIPEGESQVKKININKDGSLTDNFGVGFFDEATSWKFELLKLNNPQKN